MPRIELANAAGVMTVRKPDEMDPRIRKLRLFVRDLVGGDVWRLMSRSRRWASKNVEFIAMGVGVVGVVFVVGVVLAAALLRGPPQATGAATGVSIPLQDPTPYVASRTRPSPNPVLTPPSSSVQLELAKAEPLVPTMRQQGVRKAVGGAAAAVRAKTVRIADARSPEKDKREGAPVAKETAPQPVKAEQAAEVARPQAVPAVVPAQERPAAVTASAAEAPQAKPEEQKAHQAASQKPVSQEAAADAIVTNARAALKVAKANEKAAAKAARELRKNDAERLRDALSTVRPM